MIDSHTIPVNVVHLLPTLNGKLLKFLRSLEPADWERRTAARLWNVKDVAGHLLDGNIRVLSMLRDGFFGEQPGIGSPPDLVSFLNVLNADWVKAMKRVSPQMLIFLHEVTSPLYTRYYGGLDPFEKSPFAVDWAGESESLNWMHIAREYTEKWLHQQQVRDALNDDGIMSKEFFYPSIDIFMMALPHTYRKVDAPGGTIVRVTVPGQIGGTWSLVRTEGKWTLDKGVVHDPASELIIDARIAWKLFSKSIRPNQIKEGIEIRGEYELGEVALSMVSVMA